MSPGSDYIKFMTICYNLADILRSLKPMSAFPGSKREIVSWLLEKDNPSVRYWTLTEILLGPEHNAEVREAKAAIMATGVVPKILSKHHPDGFWVDRQNFYMKTKYKGTVWQAILPAELPADGSDKRVQSACEFLLAHSQNQETGGFAYRSSPEGDGDKNSIIPCLTGNVTWSLIRFGYTEDPRMQKALDWIVRHQRFDDGDDEAPRDWPYRREKCWGRHTCMLGIAKALKALSEIPPGKRSGAVQSAIERAAAFILKHHVFMRSHNLNMIANPDRLCLGFLLFWQTDILELVRLLLKNGIRDKQMDDAVELIFSKQDRDGRRPLEKTFNGRMSANIEAKDDPSKWITGRARQALPFYEGSSQLKVQAAKESGYADEKK